MGYPLHWQWQFSNPVGLQQLPNLPSLAAGLSGYVGQRSEDTVTGNPDERISPKKI